MTEGRRRLPRGDERAVVGRAREAGVSSGGWEPPAGRAEGARALPPGAGGRGAWAPAAVAAGGAPNCHHTAGARNGGGGLVTGPRGCLTLRRGRRGALGGTPPPAPQAEKRGRRAEGPGGRPQVEARGPVPPPGFPGTEPAGVAHRPAARRGATA